MKNKYKIHISMPSTKCNSTIIADEYNFVGDRLNFYRRSAAGVGIVIASYPAQYVILDSIEKNEELDE